MDNQSPTICSSPAGNSGMLCFTFDDGTLDHLRIAVPELEKRDWRGTFFINTRSNDRPAYRRLKRSQIAEMAARGHEIALHTVTHRVMSDLESATAWGELAWEISENLRDLTNITGIRPRTYTAPYGDYPPFMNKILEQKQILATPERYCIDSIARLEREVERFISPESFTVLAFHGVAPGFGAWGAPSERNFFPEVLDFFKALEEKIYIGTFDEIGSYRKRRQAAELIQLSAGKVMLELLESAANFYGALTLSTGNVNPQPIKVNNLPLLTEFGGYFRAFPGDVIEL